MALHRVLSMEVGVPEPQELEDFYKEIGLVGGRRCWGTADRPEQIKIAQTPYRQLRQMCLACESEQDLDEILRNLDRLGVAARFTANGLRSINARLF